MYFVAYFTFCIQFLLHSIILRKGTSSLTLLKELKMKASKFIVLLICFSTFVFSQWDTYPSYDGYVELMEKFGADYPSLCRVVEFGKSVMDRQLLAAKVSDNVGEEEKEPCFL